MWLSKHLLAENATVLCDPAEAYVSQKTKSSFAYLRSALNSAGLPTILFQLGIVSICGCLYCHN